LYPITGGPLFGAGSIQVRSIDVGDLSTAVSEVGVLGSIFSNGVEVDVGEAISGIDFSLSPSALIAKIW